MSNVFGPTPIFLTYSLSTVAFNCRNLSSFEKERLFYRTKLHAFPLWSLALRQTPNVMSLMPLRRLVIRLLILGQILHWNFYINCVLLWLFLRSAIMNGRGRITAFERDSKRFQTLERMLKRAGAANVIAKNRDFTTIDPLDPEYANVTHMCVLFRFLKLRLTTHQPLRSFLLRVWDRQSLGLPPSSRYRIYMPSHITGC